MMPTDSSTLLWSMLFGSIGTAYLVYGKKQRQLVAAAVGALLCIFPYLSSNAAVLIPGGAALMALPYLLK